MPPKRIEGTTPGRATRSKVSINGTLKDLLDEQKNNTREHQHKSPSKTMFNPSTPAARPRATPKSQRGARHASEDESDEEEDELNIGAKPRQPKFVAEAPTPSRGGKRAAPAAPTLSPTKKRKIAPKPAQPSPPNSPPRLATPEPELQKPTRRVPPTPTRVPHVLPEHLHPYLDAQKVAVLRALQNPSDADEDVEENEDELGPPTNSVASDQLAALIDGTVKRGEGNSCMVIGPRGSGKTRLVEQCITALAVPPIVIRLSGWAQHSDRLAMREIAWQLTQQTGTSFLTDNDQDEEDGAAAAETNPFLDIEMDQVAAVTLPPPSHLPALIAVLPTLTRPTVVVLDGFDLFALHARQSLLYCLLDTVQSCRAGEETKGITVIGITTRVDTINLLEKRVKSRFSGRMLRTAGPRRPRDWIGLCKAMLCAQQQGEASDEWSGVWEASVNKFLDDKRVVEMLAETFSVTRDVRMLARLLITPILQLTDSSPYLLAPALQDAITIQRSRIKFPHLHSMPYPQISLLIAATHASTAGHDIFTFEMLHGTFTNQVRASSAPVEIEGGSIGMVKCSRDILMSAFEHLVAMHIFMAVAPASASVAKEFVKHRSVVDREEVKKAVERRGETNLRKWLTKAQR